MKSLGRACVAEVARDLPPRLNGSARQVRDRLDVIRVREQVRHRQPVDPVASGRQCGEVASKRRRIARDDVKRFQAIPGIGLKTAQRVVLELKEKLTLVDVGAADGEGLTARDALVELGWSLTEAEEALAATDPELTPEERVRQALRAA